MDKRPPTERTVTACRKCPAFRAKSGSDWEGFCGLTGRSQCVSDRSWPDDDCPLRTGPVLLRLSETVGTSAEWRAGREHAEQLRDAIRNRLEAELVVAPSEYRAALHAVIKIVEDEDG